MENGDAKGTMQNGRYAEGREEGGIGKKAGRLLGGRKRRSGRGK